MLHRIQRSLAYFAILLGVMSLVALCFGERARAQFARPNGFPGYQTPSSLAMLRPSLALLQQAGQNNGGGGNIQGFGGGEFDVLGGGGIG